eukprot:TRINITY_DN11553_c0_g1_i2.p1 TRINITY_DN11553_c0_g1~~TRINITY_DN11553_c0_g1_i2.p1  ORF type:complete len:548 (-),score=4.79 TRINITY_DN11553_c0_g1_i2:997-2640(-)
MLNLCRCNIGRYVRLLVVHMQLIIPFILQQIKMQDTQLYEQDGLPKPFAYFPLLEGDISSGDGVYRGIIYNVKWIYDDKFGAVPYCSGAINNSYILLDSVPYYHSGQFAINFWFKANKVSRNNYQYIFSHTSQAWIDEPCKTTSGIKLGENQIGVFLDSYGFLRTVVKDSNDVLGSTYLYASNFEIYNQSRAFSLDWHMVTLTTRQDERRGYQFYLDGELAAEMDDTNVYQVTSIGVVNEVIAVNVDGGESILLDANIMLCGRSDQWPQTNFNGNVANLGLYDTFLTSQQVGVLFNTFAHYFNDDKPKNLAQIIYWLGLPPFYEDNIGVGSVDPQDQCDAEWIYQSFDPIPLREQSSWTSCCYNMSDVQPPGVLTCGDYNKMGWCEFTWESYCCQECEHCFHYMITQKDDRISLQNKHDLLPYLQNVTQYEGRHYLTIRPQIKTPSIFSADCRAQLGKFAQADEVNISEWPSTACYPFSTIGRLQVYYDGVPFPTPCTGTVIGSRTVLTAAHCIYIGIIIYQTNISRIVFTPGQFKNFEPFGQYEST